MRLLLLSCMAFVLSCSTNSPKTEKAVIKVSSAICGECSSTIKGALSKLDGVKDVQVNTDAKIATVEFVPASLTISDLENAIVMAGYNANDKKADAGAYEKLPDCCKK